MPGACLGKPTFTNSIASQRNVLSDEHHNNVPSLRLADPSQLLTLAHLQAGLHTKVKCSALRDGKEQ